MATTGNGEAACAEAQAASAGSAASPTASASAIARCPRRGGSCGEFGGKTGEARLVAVRSLLLYDSLGGRPIEDRSGRPISGFGFGARAGGAPGLQGAAHAPAEGDVAAAAPLLPGDAVWRRVLV